MEDIASKLNLLERWLSEGLITQENYEITKDRLTNKFMTETEPANKPKIEDFIGPGKGYTEEELLPDLWTSLLKERGQIIKPPMFGIKDRKNINQPWKSHMDLKPRHLTESGQMPRLYGQVSHTPNIGYSNTNTNIGNKDFTTNPLPNPHQDFTTSYPMPPKGAAGFNTGGSVPGYAKGGGKWLEGILSLFAGNTPKWLIDLVEKTKGGKEYVQDLMYPKKKDKIDPNFGFTSLMNDLQGRLDDQITKTATTVEEANKKLSETMDLFENFEPIDDLKFQKLKNDLEKIKADKQEMEDAGFRYDDEKDQWVNVKKPKKIKKRTVFPDGTVEHGTEVPDRITLDDLKEMSWEEAKKYGYKKEDWEYMQKYKGKDYKEEIKKEGFKWNEKEQKWIKEEVTEDWSRVPDEYRPAEFKENPEGYDKALKEQIEKEKKKGIFTLIEGGLDDDWSPPGLAKGGGFDKGLWKALMSFGMNFHKNPKELLQSFIELGFPITEKLKRQWGITEADLEFKKPTEDLKDEIEKPIQGDLFEKKNGGLISLVV